MKKIGILGSTGSIGTQTLQVIDQLPGKFDLKHLTAQQNVDLLADQALKYQPDRVALLKPLYEEEFQRAASEDVEKASYSMVPRQQWIN